MDNSDIEPLDIPNLIEEVRDEVYGNDRDGTEIDNDEITLLRFNRDRRLEEVQQLLQSSASTSFQFPDRPDLNGDELAAEQQLYAQYVADRTLALSVGRGCLTYGTSIKSTTEAFPIPEIDTDVKAVPSTLVVHFEKPADRENYLTWSKFNNGTAAGLSIPPGYSSMEEAWIQYNMKGTDVPEYAGFLLGIGLNGYLKELSAVGRYETFHEKNDFVNIGAQLGIAASWCGTGNSEIYKITAVHAPFLRPHKTNEMALTPSLQCAGIFSLGLLFLGQSHRRITLRTMTEIGRRQFEDKSTAYHRSYSLLAGFTVGMVNVGVGNSAVITNGKVVERLLLLMNRGKPPSDIAEIRSEEMCSTHLLPMEYGLMNPHTTAPSAIVALGLIFLKTNDKSIAARLEVPRNEVLLDNEPTDVLLLKVTCKNLIMWDYIRSSIDWVDSQIPNFMREHWQKYRRKGVTIGSTDFCLDDGILSAYANVVGGACFALALRFAGSNSRKIYEVLAHFMDDFTQAAAQPALTPVERVLRTNVRSSLDVIASAIGIVMAGSGDLESLRRLRRLHNRIGSEFSYGTHMAVHMAIGMLFLGGGTCTLGTSNKAIAALLAAFYPRYPSYPDDNRFHFQPLRHMWALAVERRCLVVRDAETRQALSVPLIITVGNNFAGEDSETKINMTAPCLLPEFKYIKEVQMNHDRYLPIKVDFSISNKKWNVTTEGYSLFLKKKIGYLSYLEDSVGSHNIMSEYIPKTLTLANLETLTKVIKRNEIINSFCTDPELLSFASLMCRPTQQSPKSIALADFCTSILYECIKYDKPEAIQCYLSLYYALEPFKSSPKQAQLDISTLWNLKLVLAYNERLRPRLATSNAYFSEKESFIRSSLVHDIRHLLSKYFAENYLQPLSNTTPRNLEEALQHYCRTLQFPNNMSRKLSNLFAGYLIYSDIPNLVNLCDIGRELNTVQQKHNERELEVMALLLLGNVNMEGVHKVLEAVGMN
ncbi:hypothetical protein BKA69DRAFT_1153403 [Paraphysoderma sedebokerense]|nr:hypothetical protein BKA69DRAFT_1153403 [Paraphysoderma sedebokerense]